MLAAVLSNWTKNKKEKLGSEVNFTKFHLPHILFCNSLASYFKDLHINAKVRTSVLFHFSSETAVVLQYII
jgi:hypothetical protein